ncbi:MAG: AbrB/MazE/SpoVT family DNA-binding domain-containing protein [Solimonas sp.]
MVKKWGNSAAVRIPSAILEAATLKVGAVVDARQVQGGIFIEPAEQPKALDLDTLIDAITNENRHVSVDTGAVVSKEVW